MEKQKVFTFYRLEFKKNNCSNQSKISVSGKNNVKFKNYPLYLSDFQHHQYFTRRKLSKVLDAKYSQIKITVPYWLKELIDAVAIKQISARDVSNINDDYGDYMAQNGIDENLLKSLKRSRPMRVDENCPGHAYQLSSCWGELIQQCCVSAQILGCNNENIKKMVVEEEKVKVKKFISDILNEKFPSMLARCIVGPNFVSKNEECYTIAFDILDKYKVVYDKEEILKNINIMLDNNGNFNDEERGDE